MKNYSYLNLPVILYLALVLLAAGCISAPQTYVPLNNSTTLSKKEAVNKIRAVIIDDFKNNHKCYQKNMWGGYFVLQASIKSINVDNNKIIINYRDCYDALLEFDVKFENMYYTRFYNSISIWQKNDHLNNIDIYPGSTEAELIEFQEALYVLGVSPFTK